MRRPISPIIPRSAGSGSSLYPAALLSTPDADTKAFRLYHADGFVDLARGYHFPGDSRPFAILGVSLPLHPRDPSRAND